MTNDNFVLTASQVREWQTRTEELTVSIRAQQDQMEEIGRKLDADKVELTDLGRKLEAARVLMGDRFEETRSERQETGGKGAPPDGEGSAPSYPNGHEAQIQSDDTLVSVVLTAVAAIGGAPKPIAIRRWLMDHYPTLRGRLAGDAPYFYTVISRHAGTGRLVREGKGYRLPESSPQGEAGGVAPPAGSFA